MRSIPKTRSSFTTTYKIGKTVQLLSQKTAPTHHPGDPPVERVKAEPEHGQKVSPVQAPHGFLTRCSAHVGAQAEVMDAQKDAQSTTHGVAEGDDVGHSKVSDEREVTLVIGIGFEGGLLFPLFGDRGALSTIPGSQDMDDQHDGAERATS